MTKTRRRKHACDWTTSLVSCQNAQTAVFNLKSILLYVFRCFFSERTSKKRLDFDDESGNPGAGAAGQQQGTV